MIYMERFWLANRSQSVIDGGFCYFNLINSLSQKYEVEIYVILIEIKVNFHDLLYNCP